MGVPRRLVAAAEPEEYIVQTQGSLASANLASLLQSMQSERATGTLSLQTRDTQCSLYFLFGHLFHASGDAGQGEEMVVQALTWGDGSFNFDPRAKLPAEESIKASPTELIAEAERRRAGSAAYSSNGSGGTGTDQQPLAATAADAPTEGTEVVTTQDELAAEELIGETTGFAAGVDGRTGDALATPDVFPLPREALTAEPSVAPAPSAPALPVFGNLSAPPLVNMYPLPAGKPVYESLKTAFVDFPKLLRTLRTDKYTGYVRLLHGSVSGVLLFHDGQLLDAMSSDNGILQGDAAFLKIRAHMEAGEGVIDVVDLGGETVVSLAELLTAQPLFTGLLGRFVNFDALLEYLAEEKVDGSVVVETKKETGVILLRKGVVHGAYTQSQKDLQPSTKAIATLAAEKTSRIEVKSGAGPIAGIDIEIALSKAF